MNQEKIGKFIAECRKSKNLTQSKLAEYLGVTDRSVSNWENGKNMPDLSLFKPLCEILDITINELLSGEKLEKEDYQEKFEENIVNTISHTDKKNKYISKISVLFGFGIIFTAVISLISLTVITAINKDKVNESSYQSGYSDGYEEGYQKNLTIIYADGVEVKVSGSFTATVRELMPDYMLGLDIPKYAVITLFQDGPIMIPLDEEICRELKVGETYTFIVDEQEAVLSSYEMGPEPEKMVNDGALLHRKFIVTGVRTPVEEEYGLECWRVYYSS